MGVRGCLLPVLAIVVAGATTATPAFAVKRAGTPKSATVVRALNATASATPFTSGRVAVRRARSAFAAKRYCVASTALASHQTQTARRLKTAKQRRQRGLVRRLSAAAGRGAKAKALVLRTLPKGKSCKGAPSVGVDTSVKPQEKLPSLGSGPRPVASVVDASGKQVDFAANELLVSGSRAEVEALVKRWNGKILRTVDTTKLGAPDLLFLVRIDTTRADESRLSADLAALSRAQGGAATVSSEQGLDLLAAAGREARRGTDVGVNFLGEGSALAAGVSVESPNGPAGFSATPGVGWDSNAFNWTYFTNRAPQSTGTADAWRLLRRSGKDANKVGLAVLDMGFVPRVNGPDFGSPLKSFSNVPFKSALETANLLGCGGGASCPWHGTNVANAAFAVTDDNKGVAGAGGPVADRIVVFTLYDLFTSIGALVEAKALGARVINMSYGARVPYYLAWSILPFEIATKAAQLGGNTVITAAAGNANENVDGTDCFLGACWEEAWYTPCENAGVTCVGALENNGTNKASYSNFGKSGGQVDLFAPGTILVGLDPNTPQSAPQGVHAVNGTSFAAPYLAGVAALVRAADPGMRSGAVVDRLTSTARTSSDTKVGKYVNTLSAVSETVPRLINIEAPATDPVSYAKGPAFTFSAFLHDPGRSTPTITWTLANGTVLGTGPQILTSALPYGANRVTARATFANGVSAVTDAVTVNVTNQAPTVRIAQPAGGESFVQNETLALVGEGSDPNQPGTPALSWTVDDGATAFATGTNASLDLSTLAQGAHTVTLRATDEAGAIATDTVTFTVGPPAVNRPPTVAITAPANGTARPLEPSPDATGYYALFDFQASVSDPEGAPLTYTWTETALYNPPTAPVDRGIRSTVEDPGVQRVYFSGCASSGIDRKLTVSDGTSTRSATVRIGFSDIIC